MSRSRPLLLTAVLASVAFAGCGGESDTGAASTAPPETAPETVLDTVAPASSTEVLDTSPSTAVADTAAADTAVADTLAPDTAPPATAVFDGPSFVDVVDGALVPYSAAVGAPADAASVGAFAPLAADAPFPAGATISGAGRSLDATFGSVEEEQLVGLTPSITGADLEAFGAAPATGWTQSSMSTSGSIFTLLLTNASDGRRAVYVVQEDAANTAYPPFELRVSPTDGTLVEPAWAAALPRTDGGELVEVVEGVGDVGAGFVVAGNGNVSARWRYPEASLPDLEAYLESGVVESAGFTFDRDLFNGFQQMVDITAGDWVGTVIIGEATVNGEVFYDLVWTLQRA
jgi:hypothetical protein